MRYTFLSQNFNLAITTQTSAIVNNIDGSTIYTSLAIDVKNRNEKLNIILNLWIIQYIIIVNKINIVKLKMLFNIGKQLAKACGFSNSSIAMFENLPIIIVMENFYQFFLIAGHLFWGKLQTNKYHNRKTLWLSFFLVITLI